MASTRDKWSDDLRDELSWQDERRRKRLGNRKKDSGPFSHSGEPERGKKRMGRSFGFSVDDEAPRGRGRDSFGHEDDDTYDDIDLSDIDQDLDSDPDDEESDDLEDSDVDY